MNDWTVLLAAMVIYNPLRFQKHLVEQHEFLCYIVTLMETAALEQFSESFIGVGRKLGNVCACMCVSQHQFSCLA